MWLTEIGSIMLKYVLLYWNRIYHARIGSVVLRYSLSSRDTGSVDR